MGLPLYRRRVFSQQCLRLAQVREALGPLLPVVVQPGQVAVVDQQPGTVVHHGVPHLPEGLPRLAEAAQRVAHGGAWGLLFRGQEEVDVGLQVVDVSQPEVAVLGADILQFVPEKEKVVSVAVQVPREVALEGLQSGPQGRGTWNRTKGPIKDKDV